jgi:hypothetical protein
MKSGTNKGDVLENPRQELSSRRFGNCDEVSRVNGWDTGRSIRENTLAFDGARAAATRFLDLDLELIHRSLLSLWLERRRAGRYQVSVSRN